MYERWLIEDGGVLQGMTMAKLFSAFLCLSLTIVGLPSAAWAQILTRERHLDSYYKRQIRNDI
jgi:hypothetical protein